MKKIISIILLTLVFVYTLLSCVNNEPEVYVNADGYVVVNGFNTGVLADKEDVITVDADGYVTVNGKKTEHKVHTVDEISVNVDGYVVVNGVVTDIVADKEDVITVDEDGYIVVNSSKTDYLARIDFSKLTYAAFGDSLTYGEDGFTDSRMEKPYPELVKEELGLKVVQNYGVSCLRVDQIYNRINNMDEGADIISFMGGTNDCYQSIPLGTIDDNDMSTFYGRLKILSNVLPEKHPDAFIFYMTPFKSTRSTLLEGNKNGDTLEDFAEAVKEVAGLYDIPCLDLYNYGKFELEMYEDGSDGLHPSQAFFKEYTAPQIAEFIRNNYKKQSA